jgi:hypothetical protein
MNVKRLYFVLLGLIGLLSVGLVAGAYSANNLLSQKSDSLLRLKAQSQALAQQQVGLKQAKKDIQKYAGLEEISHVVVPEDKDQAEAVRELVNIASANGVVLGSITFPISTLGGSTTVPVGSGTSTPTATPKTPSANSPTNKLSQLVAVKGLPGVYQLSINVTSDPQHPAQYSQIISFLSGLEHDRRTAQVNSISLQPLAENPKLINLTLSLNEYIKP